MALLEVNNLSKHFGGLKANDGLNLKVEKGEILGLIGPNGAGKTTFFNCIAGFYPPTSGQIIFNGEDITHLPANDICARGVARTFQLVRVFKDMSVLANVMVGAFNRTHSAAKARQKSLEVLEFCGLAPKKDLMAGGLTIANKKRLELAKAYATEPTLLMLDEAMAGLNQTETAEAVALIKKIQQKGMTIILVEHVMEVVMPISHRVYVLDYGRKIAEDVPDKVIHNEEVIKAYLGDKYHATRRTH